MKIMTSLRRLYRRMVHLLSLVTVEPVQFASCLMISTSHVVRDNLFMEKACRLDFNFTEETCFNFTHQGHVDLAVKKLVQSRVAEIDLWDGILVALPSVFSCLFLGNWSDFHGRKPLLVVPLIGHIITCTAYMLNYYFYEELGTWHLLWGALVGLFGAYQCFNIGLFGYMSDITTMENRTTRIGVLGGVFSLAYVLGAILGSRLYKEVAPEYAYYLIFGISIIVGAIGIVYTWLFVKESVKDVSPEAIEQHKLLDFQNVKDSLMTAFKKRRHNGRLHIFILVLNFATFNFCFTTARYDYLLSQLKFNWNIVQYSNYLVVQRVCRVLSLFAMLPILSQLMKLSDSMIAAVSTMGSITSYVLMSFSNDSWRGPDGLWQSGWVMFLCAPLQLESMVVMVVRSQCTKSVEKEEIGKICAVVALAQAIVPVVANPLFGYIYRATISMFPGAYLLIVVALLVLSFVGSCYLYWDENIKRRDEELETGKSGLNFAWLHHHPSHPTFG